MRLILVVVLAGISLVMTGCLQVKYADEPVYLESPGSIVVDVDSFNGNILVDADESYEFVSVHVVRRAGHGSLRRDEADESLGEIGYTVDLVPGPLGQTLQVHTFTDHVEPHFQSADVRITAPSVDGVFVKTGTGKVDLFGIQGEVEVTASGEVQLHTSRPMREPVTITTREGKISYRVRQESTGQFDCETVHGKAIAHVRHGEFMVDPSTTHRMIRGRLNDGRNRVVLRTAEGDISVAVVENPQEVGWLAKE